MGNCQAIDNASLVIQHPCGRADKLYCPVLASEVMKMNPGYYVALLLTTTTFSPPTTAASATTTTHNNLVRITRIKLLRPTDTLVLGHVYRLVPAQEVMKGLRAKKSAKMKNNQSESGEKQEGLISDFGTAVKRSEVEISNPVTKKERLRPRTVASANSATAKSRTWQPSLQSISEAAI